MLLRWLVLLLWFLVLACHGTIFAGFLPEAQAQTYCMTTSESWVLDSKRSRSCQQDISGMVSDRDVSAMLCDIFVSKQNLLATAAEWRKRGTSSMPEDPWPDWSAISGVRPMLEVC
jgi:hypothetical protein